jgi:hypothetical protein
MDTPAITTLIRKDGTGKIGIFKISKTQAVVDVPNQGKVVIDASKSDAGIRFFNNDGMLVSGLILGSIKGYSDAPRDDSETTENIYIEYSQVSGLIGHEGENVFSIVRESGDVPKEGVVVESEGNYIKTTTTKIISSSMQIGPIFANGEIDVEVQFGSVPSGSIECVFRDNNGTESTEIYNLSFENIGGSNQQYKAVLSEEIISVGSSKYYKGNITVGITLNLEGTSLVVNSCNLYVSQDKSGNRETYTVSTKTTYKYHPYTLVGVDGFVSVKDNQRYFVIDNSGSEQKILTSGLPTYDSSTHPNHVKGLEKGQLYVLGGALRVQQ